MARIRCHYNDCIHLESKLCSADSIELDPEMGCLTYTQEESEDLPDEEEWEEELFDEEDWEELDEDDLEDEDEEEEW
ncbi:MAG: hypothetical protein JW850_03385 [Thermoflexales bacterium]|nr:hypothetical protein [Thermoflexales bacterium]